MTRDLSPDQPMLFGQCYIGFVTLATLAWYISACIQTPYLYVELNQIGVKHSVKGIS